MDQDYFRTLLSTSSDQKPNAASTTRGSLLPKSDSTKQKSSVISSSEAAFKPRKVKKAEKYRDRASERRLGEGNDYAQVEAVLEEFEKSTADQDKRTVDAKRRYLGGDEEHSVLVKGLDMALLEQNKAKEALGRAAEEDDQLEKAFLEAGKSGPATAEAPTPSVKKRTREEIICELKNKRSSAGSTVFTSQEAELNKGKFKPIGFRPIGAPAAEEKVKKRKVKGDVEKKKKKRKVAEGTSEKEKFETGNDIQNTPVEEQTPRTSSRAKQPESEADLPDDFDIFADAGDYEGIDLGDDEENGVVEKKEEAVDLPPTNTKLRAGRWFADDEEETSTLSKPEPLVPSPPRPSSSNVASTSTRFQTPNDNEDGQLEDEEEELMRLVPLQSSAVPSIKDFLAMDEAAEKAEKKKKRKEKQKQKQSGSEMTAEAKANRDYQRLKSFTDKRGD